MPDIFQLAIGQLPLVVSIPHAGTQVPDEIAQRFTESASRLPDTDSDLDQLYGWVVDLGATLVSANYSRYVVDLNRPPDNERLYKTATTGLFPEVQFDGSPIYSEGQTFRDEETAARLETYYAPYHQAIAEQLERVKQQHGYAVLFDAHSIRSHVPRLFDGKLPDFNLGTNRDQSCAPELSQRLAESLQSHEDYSFVANGRFTGGYITRHYGQPADNVHAVQLELSMRTYMDDSNGVPQSQYSQERAAKVQSPLREFVEELARWKP